MLYFNNQTKQFEELKRKTTTSYKVLVTVELLKSNVIGTYGDAECPGQYISKIDGVEFYWDDLKQILINPENEIRIYNPYNDNDVKFL